MTSTVYSGKTARFVVEYGIDIDKEALCKVTINHTSKEIFVAQLNKHVANPRRPSAEDFDYNQPNQTVAIEVFKPKHAFSSAKALGFAEVSIETLLGQGSKHILLSTRKPASFTGLDSGAKIPEEKERDKDVPTAPTAADIAHTDYAGKLVVSMTLLTEAVAPPPQSHVLVDNQNMKPHGVPQTAAPMIFANSPMQMATAPTIQQDKMAQPQQQQQQQQQQFGSDAQHATIPMQFADSSFNQPSVFYGQGPAEQQHQQQQQQQAPLARNDTGVAPMDTSIPSGMDQGPVRTTTEMHVDQSKEGGIIVSGVKHVEPANQFDQQQGQGQWSGERTASHHKMTDG